MIKQITCRGTPYEIGFSHGSGAAKEIENCIAFYAEMFITTSKQSWTQVQETARSFESGLKSNWPRYYEEMRGIADGANRDILDIIAINVRTEIAFGLFSDGCTSLFWRTPDHIFLGQNWDWMEPQKPNLIMLTLHQPAPLPATITMITEAGLIGKIGLNSHGVGVCFNAIRARGMNPARIPAHVGLRVALESASAADAVARLDAVGMASSAHILIADDGGDAVGYEFTSSTTARIAVGEEGCIVHTNHLLEGAHASAGAVEPPWLEDSPARLERMGVLVGELRAAVAAGGGGGAADGSGGAVAVAAGIGDTQWAGFSRLFEDQDGYPGSICRAQEGESKSATLFNIVMDLRAREAVVKIGKPSSAEEVIRISFDEV